MCIKHTGTPSCAAADSAPGARKARTSLIMPAPAATASRMTSGFEVSIDKGIASDLCSASMTGTTRASSSASDTAAAPGRVDSPPTSMMSAPSSAICMARSSARSRDKKRPPSENESGVMFKTPMTATCRRSSARPPQSITFIVHSVLAGRIAQIWLHARLAR